MTWLSVMRTYLQYQHEQCDLVSKHPARLLMEKDTELSLFPVCSCILVLICCLGTVVICYCVDQYSTLKSDPMGKMEANRTYLHLHVPSCHGSAYLFS